MTESLSSPSFVRWLYTHNPFYAISAALMLFAVRASYGELQIGSINCWLMMGVLAGYTLLLAGVGVCIVRLGKVWEDARSILLLLLLLFLSVSISTDDLFVKATSPSEATMLVACGFIFSVVVSVGVVRALKIRIGWEYAIPYFLFLALFFATPWWCSPELFPRATRNLNWTVFLFPQIAALLTLTLLPAVRRGAKSVANNGTPWPWPWFPWTAFGVIAVAVALRSFALAMTFGQTGPIWGDLKGRSGILFDTIWGPYFLIPFAMSILLLLLEGAVAAGKMEAARKILVVSPSLLILALPWSDGPAFQTFLMSRMVATIGSPLWCTTLLLLAFFGWAALRKVEGASQRFVAMIFLLSFVGANSVEFKTLNSPHPGPLFVAGILLVVVAARRRSSAGCLGASVILTCTLWLVLPETMLARWRMATCYHVILASCITLGVICRDQFAMQLRLVGAASLPLSSLLVMTSNVADHVPALLKLLYVSVLTLVCLTCAWRCRSRWYLYAATGTTTLFGYGLVMLGFREAASVVGRATMTAFCWSAATMLIGILISAHKANWLPKRLFPDWSHGHGLTLAVAAENSPHDQNARSPDSAGEETEFDG